MIEKKLIKILENIAQLLELKGENPFKARAYSSAARIIKEQHIKIAEAVNNGTLKDIKGIGDALQKKISEFVLTGEMEYYNKLISEVPAGLVELSNISGIGFSKARQLYFENNIKSIDDLEFACENNNLANVKGFGIKSQETILSSISHKKANKGKVLQQQALSYGEQLIKIIRECNYVENAEIAGEIRRFTEIISSMDILAATKNPDLLFEWLSQKIDVENEDGIFVHHFQDEFKISIHTVNPDNFGFKFHQLTGNEDYLNAFNELVNQIDIDSNLLISSKNETELFKKIKIQFIPPELRESELAIKTALKNEIPELITESDLKGMLHVHTYWSDGSNSIKEMALKSKDLDFEYIAICDHSRTAVYTNGLSIERVIAQHEEIDKLNDENIGIKILKGIESDILTDGSLDYPEDVLEKFDLVVASVHSSFTMTKAQMTNRIIHAIMSPYTDIIGHPTGRLLLARQPYEIDIEEVIEAAAEYGKIIEINANPYRLDLAWDKVIYAKEKGVKIAINPDSHITETLSDVFLGVKVARKGWLTKSEVVNCLGLEDFLKTINHIK